jgi:mannose-6-phosphate isomerase-like protein (cupin superfamily)
MTRIILPLALAFASFTVAVFLRPTLHSADISEDPASPRPLILQESDGEHLVHRAGPLGAVPFTIKLDGQNSNAQDFFVFTEALAAGQTIPFHKHDNAEEILIFEEEGATVMVGDKLAVAGPHSIVFIPRDTWISATNTGAQDIHLVCVFSRQGFERCMRAIGSKQGEPLAPLSPEELSRLRASGHSTYWDTSKGPYPPGVAHP